MKKDIVVGIFAHPDDETFGPGGTLAVFSKTRDIYLICVTNGDGKQEDRYKEKQLGKIRKKELLNSAKILGVKKVFFLGYRDGSLQHNLYHEIAKQITTILQKLQPKILITFEPRGVSGHIDHIVISMITSFIFPNIPSAKKLMKYCVSDERSQAMGDGYFIHFPLGYTNDEIDEIVDVSAVWETKVIAMHHHISQMHDVKRILERGKNLPKQETFLVVEKT
jgi:LmbE family N-acetylglucosaminyl deacetylase